MVYAYACGPPQCGTSYVRVMRQDPSSGQWSQVGQDITISQLAAVGAYAGQSVIDSIHLSPDGNTMAIGGPYSPPDGKVVVYVLSGGLWVQKGQELLGTRIEGYWVPSGSFGSSVSMSDDTDTLVVGDQTQSYDPNMVFFDRWVGDPGYDTTMQMSSIGAVYVFQFVGGVWVLEWSYMNTQGGAVQWLGSSVQVSGDGSRFVVSAPRYGGASQRGWVAVFQRDAGGGNWTMLGQPMIGPMVRDMWGVSVSMSR